MTGMAFLLFTFYMVPDPGTTPSKPARQLAFGAGVGALYGVLVSFHIVFAPFYALCLVCAVRGVALHVAHFMAGRGRGPPPPPCAIPRPRPACASTTPARDAASRPREEHGRRR